MATHRVYFVRHAKAEQGAGDDASRHLTSEGRRRFARLVGAIGGRVRIARILSSPLVRARETAEILARSTGAAVEIDARLAAGASSARELVAMAREATPGTALVGHNPELAEAVTRVAGEDLEVKPGAVAALDVGEKDVRLAWLEVPQKE